MGAELRQGQSWSRDCLLVIKAIPALGAGRAMICKQKRLLSRINSRRPLKTKSIITWFNWLETANSRMGWESQGTECWDLLKTSSGERRGRNGTDLPYCTTQQPKGLSVIFGFFWPDPCVHCSPQTLSDSGFHLTAFWILKRCAWGDVRPCRAVCFMTCALSPSEFNYS